MNWLARLFCPHEMVFVRNIYGDEILYSGKRSVWRCQKCGKISWQDALVSPK